MAKKNKNVEQTETSEAPKVKRVRGVQINTKLVGFVAQCMNDNTLDMSKADVIEAYQTAVGVKSPKNIDNIAKRNLRPAVEVALQESLDKFGISREEYAETQTLLVQKIKRQEGNVKGVNSTA